MYSRTLLTFVLPMPSDVPGVPWTNIIPGSVIFSLKANPSYGKGTCKPLLNENHAALASVAGFLPRHGREADSEHDGRHDGRRIQSCPCVRGTRHAEHSGVSAGAIHQTRPPTPQFFGPSTQIDGVRGCVFFTLTDRASTTPSYIIY